MRHFVIPATVAAMAAAGGAPAAEWATCIACPAVPATAPRASGAEIHYGPAENLEAIDVGLIEEAGETIDMAAYVLTDVALIDALADAADRGVRIRIVREASEIRPGFAENAVQALLKRPGVESKVVAGEAIMHLKAYAVDGRGPGRPARPALRTGSANFSASGLKRQDNDLAILRDAASIARFESDFEALWRRP